MGACSWGTARGSSDHSQVLQTRAQGLRALPVVSLLWQGCRRHLAVLQAPAEVSEAIVADVEQVGVVSMAELTVADCESLRTWSSLRPLQQQRLSQFIASLLA